MDLLRIRLLGQLDVQGLSLRDIGSRKGRTLLTALAAARGEMVPADWLADVLWPQQLPANPSEQVQVLVSRLRNVLGADRVQRIGIGYQLRYDWLDLDELDRWADEAGNRAGSGASASARAAAVAALRLMRGRPIDGEDGEWADLERGRIARTVASVRLIAAEAALAGGMVTEAVRLADDALRHDPFDEPALRILMLGHVAAGRPAAALAAYARTRQTLADQLGVGPTDATEALHADVLLGTVRLPSMNASPRNPDLIGRQHELAFLDTELDRASAGPARVVVVAGEPGIGKSALLRSWVERIAGRGAAVVRIDGDPACRDLPLQPVLDALDALARSGLTHIETAPDRSPRLPDHDSAAATSVGDHDVRRATWYLDLLARFQRFADGAPLVLIVDDANDVDAATITWLQFAAGRCTALLVVLAVRPPIPPAIIASEKSSASVLELRPIQFAAAERLVGMSSATQHYARSGGNPLYLLELARSPGGTVPDAVLDNARHRADSLGGAAPTIRAAAVLGTQVDVDLLSACLGRPVAQVLDDLEAATAAHLLIESGAGFAFTHDLVRDALAQTLTGARRAHLHREATRSLRGRVPDEVSRAAFHAQQGGATSTAAAALVDGAAIAATRFELEISERLLDESIRLLDCAPARLARARVRMARSNHDGAADDLANLVGPDADASVFELAGWVAYYRRDFAAARRCADEALRLAPSDEVRASAHALAGRVRHSQGELAEANAHLDLAMADPSTAAASVGSIWLGALRVHLGRFDDAIEALEQDGTMAARPHPFVELHGLMSRCMAHGLNGQVSRAFEVVSELDRVVATHGAQGLRFRSIAANLRGWLLRSVGNEQQADVCNQRALGSSVGAAFEEPYAHARLDLADGCLRRSDLVGALRWIDAAEAGVGDLSTMAWHIRQRSMWLRGRAAALNGEFDHALTVSYHLVDDADRRGSRRYGVLGRHLAAVATAGSLANGQPGRNEPGRGEPGRGELVADLDHVAGLEAWRLTLELAEAYRDDQLVGEAEVRAERLAVEASRCPDVDSSLTRRWIQQRLGGSPHGA